MNDDHVHPSPRGEHVEADGQWAFGTGFEDPLYGADTAVPDGIDGAELASCCLLLADDALIAAQRLAQWCTNAPELEEELALANIGLDLLGQARHLYARAGRADGTGRGEDAYAYFRHPAEFRNVRLVELPNGDYAFSVVRLFVFATWRLELFTRLTDTPDPVLAAIASKSINELAYHRSYAAQWVVRLGDGTAQSRLRARRALDEVAPHLAELFTPHEHLRVDVASVRAETTAIVSRVLDTAGLVLPITESGTGGGRDGLHTEHLPALLTELQSVARADPQATW
ncbi:1,2-phenylacetyl-CoA epoxidase subunit PaaC [Embleya sp. NPDC059237]|uniref:1,2-phenylacetyl-CoA epoxidase subunit PaaC n=1 Tax=Embleya sp. NPDC059237 TaxID=3346784 RepID=UPI0036BD51BF